MVTRPSGLVVPTGQALAGFAGQSARQVAQDPSAQIETVQHFNQPTGVETGLDIGQVQREGLGETVIGDASIFSPQPQPTSPKVEIKDAVIEPVRKPQVDDPIIIDIFERPIETEFPASPKIVEPEIKPAVIEDASIFRPQPQPKSDPRVDIEQLPLGDDPQQKPRLPIRLPDEERRKVPNTGGRYPATVVHRADVIVTTDLDTGEHTAALVELKSKPQVGARQPKPAAAKKIRGRTLDVEAQTGGQIKTTPRSRARSLRCWAPCGASPGSHFHVQPLDGNRRPTGWAIGPPNLAPSEGGKCACPARPIFTAGGLRLNH